MNNFKNTVKSNFTAIPNTAVNDDRLSWKAKGIFLYLASKPDDWKFYMNEIKINATDGKTSLQNGIKELENNGYLKRTRMSDENNKFVGWHWELLIPRQTENPSVGKSVNRKTPSYNKTNNTKTNITKKEDIKSVSTEVVDVETEYDELAIKLKDSICRWDNTHKYNSNPPSLDRWASQIRLAIERDGRTHEQLEWMINYLFLAKRDDTNSFWASNIQSADKLRLHFDTIKNKIKANRNANTRNADNYEQKLAEADDFLDRHYSGT